MHSSSYSSLTRSKALDRIYLAFNSVPKVYHLMGILNGKQCMAQTVLLPSRYSTACSPQLFVPTHPMAWAAFLKCRSKAKQKVVTSSKVHLPLYFGRLDDMTAKQRRPDVPRVGFVEPPIPNMGEVVSKEP